MNAVLQKLLLQVVQDKDGEKLTSLLSSEQIEQFGMLVVRECINVIGPDNYTMLTGVAFCESINWHFNPEQYFVEEEDDDE